MLLPFILTTRFVAHLFYCPSSPTGEGVFTWQNALGIKESSKRPECQCQKKKPNKNHTTQINKSRWKATYMSKYNTLWLQMTGRNSRGTSIGFPMQRMLMNQDFVFQTKYLQVKSSGDYDINTKVYFSINWIRC